VPSVSKAQQRFMGLVHAYKKGEVPASQVSQAVKDAAKSMKKKSTKKFASTKHKGLPNKVRSENMNEISAVAFQGLKDSKGQMWDLFWREKPPYVIPFNARGPKTKVKDITDTKLKKTVLKVLKNFKNESVNEKVIKVSKKDDIPGNPMKMKGEEKIKKLTYSGSVGMDKPGSYEIKGNKLNVNNIRPRDKGFFVRHFTMGTGFRKANLYYDGVHWQGGKKF
jgi:hypothetical protein